MNSRSPTLPCTPLAIALHVALACLSVAQAQESPQAPSPTPQRAPQADSAGAIQEVVVTAQKRTELASKVPSAISVVGQAQLERQHVSQLSDLAGYLPSVQIDNAGTPGQTTIAARGIPTLGAGSVVGTYLDDTPLGSSSNFGRGGSFVLDLLPYDIARIELLRGPQGTLYGASAMGGLLKYVTNEPDLKELSGRAGLGISSVDGAGSLGHEERAMLNVPLIQDQLAARISLSNNRTPGYIDNVRAGASDINRVGQQYGRLAVLWRPNQDFSLKLSALRQKIDADDNSLTPVDPVSLLPLVGERQTRKLVAEPFAKTVDYYSATLNFDLRWADLTTATSYSKTRTRQLNDMSNQFGLGFPMLGAPAAGISKYALDLDLKKVTQEVRLASKQAGKLEWLINAFYTREKSANDQLIGAASLDGATLPGLDPLLSASQPSIYREKAVYGSTTYKFSEQFDVTGGLRYARNNQSYQSIMNAGVLAPLGTASGTSGEGVTTYMFSPRYHLNAHSMLYARVASGYRAGGPNAVLPGVPPTVGAEKLVNYEVGVKSQFFQRRAAIELAAYQIRWHDIQLAAVTDTGLGYLANAGKAKSQGIELTTSVQPIPALRLAFNAAYTDAKLTEDAPAIRGKAGDTMQVVPQWTWSLTSDYSFSVLDSWAAHVGGGYSWTDARNSGAASDPLSHRLSSYGVLNLNADIGKGPWTLRAYVKNLNNSNAVTAVTNIENAFTGGMVELTAVRPQPRTIGLELDVSF
nr:TonB-dependent receptor [uncultured Duganella sp.]